MKLSLWKHHPHPGLLRTSNKNAVRREGLGISPQHPSEVGTVTTPILQTGKLRLVELKWPELTRGSTRSSVTHLKTLMCGQRGPCA